MESCFPGHPNYKIMSPSFILLFFFFITDDATQQSSGLSAGAIAGIVIGVLAGVALIAALVYFLYIRKTGGYDAFPLVPLSPRLTTMLGRGKETLSLSLGLDLLLLLKPLLLGTKSCGSLHASCIPLCLGHGDSLPHLIREGRSSYAPLTPSQGSQGPRRKTNEEMKGGAGESKLCALSTTATGGGRDRTGREPKKKQNQPKASRAINKVREKTSIYLQKEKDVRVDVGSVIDKERTEM